MIVPDSKVYLISICTEPNVVTDPGHLRERALYPLEWTPCIYFHQSSCGAEQTVKTLKWIFYYLFEICIEACGSWNGYVAAWDAQAPYQNSWIWVHLSPTNQLPNEAALMALLLETLLREHSDWVSGFPLVQFQVFWEF